MKILRKFKFHFLFFFVFPSLNYALPYDGLLNNSMTLYHNSTFTSLGAAFGCFPFSELTNQGHTKFFTDIYFTLNFQHLWLLQTNYFGKVMKFFPYFGIEIFYLSFKWCLFRSMLSFFQEKNKAQLSSGRATSGSTNIVMIFEPEYDLSLQRRCCQQIGIGISLIYIDRCVTYSNAPNYIREKNALSLGLGPFIDICFIHKVKFKFKYNPNTEIHISLGYVYNPLLLYSFISVNSPKDIKINEPGLFNFFIQFDLGSISDKGKEEIDWFNNGKVVYKRVKRTLRHNISFFPFLVGQCYCKMNNVLHRRFFTGFYYSMSSPYLFSLSKVHYIGFYWDLNVCFPELKSNSNSTGGITFTSNYKSIVFEHNVGFYIFADGGFLRKRQISSVPQQNNNVAMKPISNHLVYRPRLYLKIHRFFVEWRGYKLWNILKRIRLFIGLNIMLYTITNTKNTFEQKKTNKKYYDYISAQVESYIFGFSIE